MGILKKLLPVLLAVILLAGSSAEPAEEGIDLSVLQARENFIFDEDSETGANWTYYSIASAKGSGGETVEIMLVSWGLGSALTYSPELRIFVTGPGGAELYAGEAVLLIGANLFQIHLSELSADVAEGTYAELTAEDEELIKSFAAGRSCKCVLQCSTQATKATFSETDLEPLRTCAADMLRYDFLGNIRPEDPADIAAESVIQAHIYEEIDKAALLAEEPAQAEPDGLSGFWSLVDQVTALDSPAAGPEEEWTEYFLPEVGIRVSVPSEFLVFTRGMSPDDPALAAAGITPEYVDEVLAEGNSYFDASWDDFSSEFIVTMIENELADFSSMSDSGLLSMTYLLSSAFESYQITILDQDVFSCNGIKYLRLHEQQTLEDGRILYKIQYYTTVQNRSINLIFSSSGDEVTDAEKEFMQSLVERADFSGLVSGDGSGDAAQDGEDPAVPESVQDAPAEVSMRTYVLEEGPFSVTMDQNKYNILVPGMDPDEPAVIRSGLSDDRLQTYLRLINKDFMLFGLEDTLPAEFEIDIRIKDGKYDGIDVRNCSAAETTLVLDKIYESFGSTAAEKEIVQINGVSYLKFSWMSGAQLRYATIIGGDMIYIWAERDDGGITAEDAALLLEVVEAIEYPEN